MPDHPVVSREEWLPARRRLLEKEKAHTCARDALNAERRSLPWVRIARDYAFDALAGRRTLADLFEGRSELMVYHFMLGPGWDAGCTGCSFIADHFDGALPHVLAGGASFVAVSRAPLPEIEAYRARMGWRFPWVSSNGSDFNYDFGVSFTPEAMDRGEATYNYRPKEGRMEDLHGFSVFTRDASGEVFHTYSTYGRGLEEALGAFMLLDRTPLGRNEDGTMSWVRRHDEYAPREPAVVSCCAA